MKHIKTISIQQADVLTEQAIMDFIAIDWDAFDELHIYTSIEEIEKFSQELDKKYCISVSNPPITVNTYRCMGKDVILFGQSKAPKMRGAQS